MTDCTNRTHGAQLRECPFCGVEAHGAHEDYGDTHYWRVYCDTIGCAFGISKVFHSEAEVIAAWNARAERTCRMETAEGCQNWNSCSECHADYYTDQPINYCPNCGARVIGTEAGK